MIKAKVCWTDLALNDLETIYDFLAEKSRPAAQRLVEAILNRTRQLESFPESGAPLVSNKFTHQDYRFLVEGNYKIVYCYITQSSTVYVATLFDARLHPDKFGVSK